VFLLPLRRCAKFVSLMAATGAVASAQIGPLSLDTVVRAASKDNPLVEAAGARLRAAEASRRAAAALPNPVFTYSVEDAPYPGGTQPEGLDREVSTYLTIPLEPLYQRKPRIERAVYEIDVAGAQLLMARWMVIQDAVHAFDRFVLARLAVQNAADVRNGLESLVEFNATRVREGAIAEVELIRGQIELARAGLDETTARVELAHAWGELRPFLPNDVPADPTAVPLAAEVHAPSIVAGPLPSFSELSARARSRQPELAAARSRVDALRAEERLQGALTLRQVGATFGNKRVAGENTMIAGISLPLPIFDRNRGEIARAAAERSVSEWELDWVERGVTSRLRAAYDAATMLDEQSRPLGRDLISRAEEARSISLAAYREGAATLLQVIDASRTLGDVRRTYYRAVFAAREARVALAAASGADPDQLGPEGVAP
jgi:cobalt-zinc-cadmium efflux system outer membrane protein